MLAEAQKTIARRDWQNVRLIHGDAAKLKLQGLVAPVSLLVLVNKEVRDQSLPEVA